MLKLAISLNAAIRPLALKLSYRPVAEVRLARYKRTS
jgi:hypothetical protein